MVQLNPKSFPKFWIIFIFVVMLLEPNFIKMTFASRKILKANAKQDTYTQISKVLGSGSKSYEVPDCGHKVPHITIKNDPVLNKPVFLFHIHRDLDDDACTHTDRQRVEIKTLSSDLIGQLGDTLSYSWNFWLDSGFQPSKSFGHIHQIKAAGKSKSSIKNKSPIITLTPRKKSSQDELQVIHEDNNDVRTVLGSTNLNQLKGNWIHVEETVTYGKLGLGSVSVTLSRLNDGVILYSLKKDKLDTSRDGATTYRGKWGIYRGLDDKKSLRDEIVKFDSICIAKDGDKC